MFNSNCMNCVLQYVWNHLPEHVPECERMAYLKDCFHTLSLASPDSNGVEELDRMETIYCTYFGERIHFEEEKKQYNTLMLSQYPALQAQLQESSDPLRHAVQLALTGNYIDFGALSDVCEDTLMQTLADYERYHLDEETWNLFVQDLQQAKKLVYLADNCGEIVLDKLLMRVMRQMFPALQITVIVRGAPVINDVTEEDARLVGFEGIAEVLSNGTALAGTVLHRISPQAKQAIYDADIILSKGLGNLETLRGCGLNIYYLFLCKCPEIERLYNMKRYEGKLLRERS